jgi:tryptophan-rich sensory protein
MNNYLKLLISVVIPLIIGGISGGFTVSGINSWYATINKPWFNPPNWIFGPVWTSLYVMMGIAFYLIWKSDAVPSLKSQAITLFFIQLIVNFLWSIIFFYLQQPGWAFFDIVIMWVMILLTIFSFGKISSTAAWLLVPYICWVSFASVLNFAIWKLN